MAAPDDDPAAQRWVEEPVKRSARSAYQRDRARVLHSAALRRLAAKTQVVVAGEADFPRTRLTHSLEVAQIGRELGQALGCDPDVVEVAGLAHDLGHPPFGHNGEAALDEVAQPYGGFEGNAQTLRVLTRLEAKAFAPDDGPLTGRSVGLNLTRASLDAATKYPWTRRDDSRKFGVYPTTSTSSSGCARGRRGSGAAWRPRSWTGPTTSPTRCTTSRTPSTVATSTLAQLLDPAERTAVAELAARTYAPDAEPEELEYALLRLQAQPWWPRGYDGSMHALAALKNLTSELIGRFCTAAEEATRAAYAAPRLSRYDADLVVPRATRLECAALKAVAAVYVMQRAGAGPVYARQQELVQGLYVALLQRAPDALAPELRPAFEAAADDTARVRVVVDQVASLTDISAVAVHRRLTGSSVTVVGGEWDG